MAAVGAEIFAVHRPDFASLGEFSHSHEAGVGKVHRQVGVFHDEREDARHFIREDEVGIENQIATGDELEDFAGSTGDGSRLGEHRVTSVKRRMLSKCLSRPFEMAIESVERADDEPSVSDSFHVLR